MADLFHRVSIRKFKDEAVSNEDIGYILGGSDGSAVREEPAAVGVLCSGKP